MELFGPFLAHPIKKIALVRQDEPRDPALWRVGFDLSCDMDLVKRVHKVMKALYEGLRLYNVKAPRFTIAKGLSGEEAYSLLKKMNNVWREELELKYAEVAVEGLTLIFHDRMRKVIGRIDYPFSKKR